MLRLSTALFVLALLVAGPVTAAPIQTQTTLRLELVGIEAFEFHGSGTVSVSGSTVYLPAGMVTLPTTLVIPVTSTTSIRQFRLTRMSNLAGSFSPGGALGAEVCTGGPDFGEACHGGGGVGGAMGLTGRLSVTVLQHGIPLAFTALRVGIGGAGTSPFTADGALWSTGPGYIGTASGTTTRSGSGAPLQLVAPVYIAILGTEIPIFATLTLHDVFLTVPEPSALFLWVLAGLSGWVAFRR